MEEMKIKVIKAAEQEANEIVEDARKEYRKIIQSAQDEGAQILEKDKEKSREESRKIIEQSRSEARKESDGILSGMDGELSAIRKQAESAFQKAVDCVLKAIRE